MVYGRTNRYPASPGAVAGKRTCTRCPDNGQPPFEGSGRSGWRARPRPLLGAFSRRVGAAAVHPPPITTAFRRPSCLVWLRPPRRNEELIRDAEGQPLPGSPSQHASIQLRPNRRRGGVFWMRLTATDDHQRLERKAMRRLFPRLLLFRDYWGQPAQHAKLLPSFAIGPSLHGRKPSYRGRFERRGFPRSSESGSEHLRWSISGRVGSHQSAPRWSTAH